MYQINGKFIPRGWKLVKDTGNLQCYSNGSAVRIYAMDMLLNESFYDTCCFG